MLGFIAALLLFGALAGGIAVARGTIDDVDARPPQRLPDPGPRDLHAVTGLTLVRAHVPSWG